MIKLFTTLFLLFLLPLSSWAQQSHLIFFKDKDNSNFSINQPEKFLTQRSITRRQNQSIVITERDLPVNSIYTQELIAKGAKLIYTSKWFNAAIIEADIATLAAIETLPFVEKEQGLTFNIDYSQHSDKSGIASIETKNTASIYSTIPYNSLEIKEQKGIEEDYGASATQNMMIGIDAMHDAGYHGEGMLIAVLDAGFKNVDKLSLFSELDITGTYDFVYHEESVFEDHAHGRNVLATLAGYSRGNLIGGAYKASYYLFKTEDGRSESPLEEVYWVIAAERADSLGVDIIQTSLGYNTFDNSKYDYEHSDLDGKTALITQGANWAADAGILIVKSAGNEGNKSWQKLTVPADSEKILTVGAVDEDESYANFSSLGYNANGTVKPDLMAMGQSAVIWANSDNPTTGNGTSYAAPILCGLATGFWQANPSLTNFEVIEALQYSGKGYKSPTPKMGYGIPHFDRAQKYVITGLENENIESQLSIYPNPLSNGQLHIRFGANELNKNIQIIVTDITGRQILNQHIEIKKSEFELNFNGELSKGLYLLSVIDSGEKQVLKFIKN
jgi:subtilisin family serine protease